MTKRLPGTSSVPYRRTTGVAAEPTGRSGVFTLGRTDSAERYGGCTLGMRCPVVGPGGRHNHPGCATRMGAPRPSSCAPSARRADRGRPTRFRSGCPCAFNCRHHALAFDSFTQDGASGRSHPGGHPGHHRRSMRQRKSLAARLLRPDDRHRSKCSRRCGPACRLGAFTEVKRPAVADCESRGQGRIRRASPSPYRGRSRGRGPRCVA